MSTLEEGNMQPPRGENEQVGIYRDLGLRIVHILSQDTKEASIKQRVEMLLSGMKIKFSSVQSPEDRNRQDGRKLRKVVAQLENGESLSFQVPERL